MQCPNCNLENPLSAERCDCGYDFASASLKESYLLRSSEAGIDIAGQQSGIQNSSGCRSCGAGSTEQDYDYKLCSLCRDKLANRPLPIWSRYFFTAIAILVVAVLVHFPESITSGLAYQRGRNAEAAGQWAEASVQYSIVAQRFPDSTMVQAKLGLSHFKNGEYAKAIDAFNKISGRKTSSDLVREVNAAIDAIEKKSKVGE